MEMNRFGRRQFLKTTALGAGSVLGFPAIVRGQNLNDRISVGCVGVGGQGARDLAPVAKCKGVDIAALCDVDARTLERMAKKYPDAQKHKDFREMISKMDKDLDAVMVCAPDHIHGVVGIQAMQAGKHVFVEKPLTQTVWESRVMRKLAAEKNLATQMGNQGSASEGLRRSVEIIQSGVFGKPLEMHVWTNRPFWPQGIDRPTGSDPVPDYLDWDLWLGPAPDRPYKEKVYHDFKWRGWNDFGTGALGDMACHTVNMPFRALQLGYPEKIECEMASRIYSETYPLTSRVRFDFPARGEDLPPLSFWWYDGNPGNDFDPIRPNPNLTKELFTFRKKMPETGCLIVFEKGKLYSEDSYGEQFFIKMNDEKEFSNGQKHPLAKDVPQSIKRSPGHYQEWIDMINGGDPAYSNFEIAAYLNEVILLGCIAQRVGEGKPIKWDGPNAQAIGNDEASALVKRSYRKGWEVKA